VSKCSFSLHILVNVGFYFLESYSDWGEVESQCSFDFISLMVEDVEYFLCIYWPFVLT
jgi:hypothetical protein